ncbi:MAG: MBL fold metallo-hydrolase [Chloroflexota bacterium]
MAIQLTTLGENTAGTPRVLGEWGLSILVETDDVHVLVDTCATNTVPHNAWVLGVDLSTVDKVMLSHGHYDHTGGLRDVLARTGPVEVIGHPDIWGAKYAVFGERRRYNGIPFVREELESRGASFTLSSDPVWITDNVVTTGEIPMVTDYEEVDKRLFVGVRGELVPDLFPDDRALIVKTEKGLVVVLGCAHRGMINTLYHARDITGEERIHMVVGGTHLISASEERILRTIEAVRELGVDRLGVSHCTGLAAASVLAGELGESFFFNNAGTRISIE